MDVVGNRTYTLRVKHVTLRCFFTQDLAEEGRIGKHYVKTESQLVEISTEHLSKHTHPYLIKLRSKFTA